MKMKIAWFYEEGFLLSPSTRKSMMDNPIHADVTIGDNVIYIKTGDRRIALRSPILLGWHEGDDNIGGFLFRGFEQSTAENRDPLALPFYEQELMLMFLQTG